MKESDLRKFHRIIGSTLAPLIILQAISGIFLGVDWLLGYHQRVGQVIRKDLPLLVVLWDKILVTIHYGFDLPGNPYHTALGIGLILITISGIMIFLKMSARKKE